MSELRVRHAIATVPDAAEVLLAEGSDGRTPLSPCELAVLCDAANGLTALETAEHQGKGEATVKTQRSVVLLKMGARNVAQAVGIATQQGLLVADHSRKAA
jgi:DNA-binding NarL/FixJ family response regulator